jgi:DNA-binding NtrC family response regulator
MPRSSEATLASALIVEDDRALADGLQKALAGLVDLVACARSVAEARASLAQLRPELLILDVMLPDGTAFDVLEQARRLEPFPMVVAISGGAEPEDTFQLATLGVRAFLRKPIDLQAIEAALVQTRSTAPDLTPHLRATVGRRGVRDVEEQVRRVMVREALASSGGSRRGAARMLSVSRQLLQHIVRAFDGAP